MIPPFQRNGNLPPGIYWASWDEIVGRFGTSEYRQKLLTGFLRAIRVLRQVGCSTAYLDGSFVTTKEIPGDFDGCWDQTGVSLSDLLRLEPALVNFLHPRQLQKDRFGGEMFPAGWDADGEGQIFLDFFQIDKRTGEPKGIVAIDLRGLP